MDCKITAQNIIDFQFGNLTIDQRDEVETHLASCSDCLREFFLLKRDAESAQAVPLRPGKAVRSSIEHEFSDFANIQIQEQQKERWLAVHPKKFILGGLVAAAALVLIILSNQKHLVQTLDQKPDVDAVKAELVRSLDETVDSGGSSPGHINII